MAESYSLEASVDRSLMQESVDDIPLSGVGFARPRLVRRYEVRRYSLEAHRMNRRFWGYFTQSRGRRSATLLRGFAIPSMKKLETSTCIVNGSFLRDVDSVLYCHCSSL